MASSKEKVFPAFDIDTGLPITGLSPSWLSLFELSTGQDIALAARPTIRDAGHGFYAFLPSVPVDGHWVGVIDLGATADPRYQSFHMRYEDSIDQLPILQRILGMLHENSVFDLTNFDPATNVLTSGRLRLYGTKADADAASSLSEASPGQTTTYDTNKLAQYSIRAAYQGPNLLSYEVALEASN